MRTTIVNIECFNQECPSHVLSEAEYEKKKGDSWRIIGPLGEGWTRYKKEEENKYRVKHIKTDDHVNPPEWRCCACGKSGADFNPQAHYNGPSYPYYNASLGQVFQDKGHERKYAKDNGFAVKDYRAKNRARTK